MTKLSINLLPVELKEEKQIAQKKTIYLKISVAVLIATIVITAIIFIIRINQTLALKTEKESLDSQKSLLSQYQEQEVQSVILKNKLSSIDSLIQKGDAVSKSYNLIDTLVPEGLTVRSIAVTAKDKVTIAGDSPNILVIQDFFDSLSNPVKNEGLINSVNVDSLAVSSGLIVRFELTIKVNTNSPTKTSVQTNSVSSEKES